jgi:hypothetical protein
LARRRSSSDGSGTAALVFLGLAAGVTVVSTSRQARAETAPRPSGRGRRFASPEPASTPTPTLTPPSPSSPSSPIRYTPMPHGFDPLVERWRPEVARRAGDLPVDGVLQWIQIESGGDTCGTGSPSELGIFQLNFPGDAKYGATIEGLRSICQRSKGRKNPADLSWMTPTDLDMEVGAGIAKVRAARDEARRALAAAGVTWPEDSIDFWSAVKQIHATPAVINELLPKIAKASGPPASWADLRERVMTFPVDQVGPGLQRLSRTPSQHHLRNRLEDTMRNASFVGLAVAHGPIMDVA